MNTHLAEYERLNERLQCLVASDQGESEEADKLRDQMDEPWSHLTPEEIATLQVSSQRESDGLFHTCVGMGADAAAVAAWPDHRRRSFIANGY